MPKTSRELAIVLFIASSFLAPPCRTEAGQADRARAKFEPPDGKAMVLIGCEWSDNFKQYKRLTGDTPAGGVFWYVFNGDTNFFWHNAKDNVGPGGVMAIHIGPSDKKAVEELLSGQRDENIRKLGRAFKEWGHPLFVAIGPEFDHKDNRAKYTAAQYVDFYRRVHRIWNDMGVTNVAYVWHSYVENLGKQTWAFYPGDEYVDWFGISLYWPNQFQAAPTFASAARARKKPLIVMESSSINGKTRTFEDWHGPYLSACASLGVRVLCYNNFRDHPQIAEPFKHSAFDQLPRPIADAWGRAMKSSVYLHASPALYATLGAQAQDVARPADEPTMDEAKGEMILVRRISLSLTDTGDCSLSVDTRTEIPPIEDPQGKLATIAGLPNAEVTVEEDGTHRAVYSFGEVATTADFASLNGSPMPSDGLSIDRTAGALLLTPILVGKGPVKKSSFSFPRYTKAPVTETIDFEKFDNYTVFLTLKFAEGLLQVRVSPRHPGWQQDGSRLGATFTPIVNKRAGKESVILEGRLEPEKLAEYAFHVPADPSILGERCELNVHLQGHEPASIARLDVRAKVPPTFGSVWEADKGDLKVKMVIKGGPSEKAGLRAGDVLVSLDGGNPSNVADLIDRLGRHAVGDEAELVVRRGGQEKAILIKGE